jgi:hypothetical protein
MLVVGEWEILWGGVVVAMKGSQYFGLTRFWGGT